MYYHSKHQTGYLKKNYSYSFSATLLCLLLLITNKSTGQLQAEKNKQGLFLSINVLASRSIVIDKKFSALPFSGTNAGTAFAAEYRRGKTAHHIEAYYTKGNLSTGISPKNKLNQRILNIEYSNVYLIYISKNKLLQCHAGPGIQLLYNKKFFENFINLNRSFETALSLVAAFQVKYNLPDDLKGLSISNRFVIPLAGAISQPVYASNSADEQELTKSYGFSSFFKTAQAVSINKFFSLKNNLAIEKKLNDKHTLAVNYNWAYYKVKTVREVVQANHQLGILYQYKL